MMSRTVTWFVDRTRKFLSAKTESIWAPPSSTHTSINAHMHTHVHLGHRLPKGFRGPLHPAVVIKQTVRAKSMHSLVDPTVSVRANRSRPPAHQAIQLNFGWRCYGAFTFWQY